MATHLAPALENMGYSVRLVYSRNPENAKTLCKKLYQAEVARTLDFSNSSPEIFILSVSDDALEEVASEIILPENAMVMHTSGTQPLSLLGYTPTEHIGVFYPLQTFTKEKKVDFSGIPICLEGETPEIRSTMKAMAATLSDSVQMVNTHDRKVLHLAAVFACNFANHLFTISEEILENRGLDFAILHPLIVETLNKSLTLGPSNSQTGPAIRNDTSVIHSQLQYLMDREDLANLYREFTEQIQNKYSSPN